MANQLAILNPSPVTHRPKMGIESGFRQVLQTGQGGTRGEEYMNEENSPDHSASLTPDQKEMEAQLHKEKASDSKAKSPVQPPSPAKKPKREKKRGLPRELYTSYEKYYDDKERSAFLGQRDQTMLGKRVLNHSKF